MNQEVAELRPWDLRAEVTGVKQLRWELARARSLLSEVARTHSRHFPEQNCGRQAPSEEMASERERRSIPAPCHSFYLNTPQNCNIDPALRDTHNPWGPQFTFKHLSGIPSVGRDHHLQNHHFLETTQLLGTLSLNTSVGFLLSYQIPHHSGGRGGSKSKGKKFSWNVGKLMAGRSPGHVVTS